ncbi:hypothetical protein Bca101_082946 [Brassica carinata]
MVYSACPGASTTKIWDHEYQTMQRPLPLRSSLSQSFHLKRSPEYVQTGHLLLKRDLYSFGVGLNQKNN